MPPIEKPRGRRGRDSRRGGRRGNGRRREKLRTEAEQLDYEMELLRAQREGREEEFRAHERAKLRARKAASLDAEMDEYFKKRDEKPEGGEDAKPSDDGKESAKGSDKPTSESISAAAPTTTAAETASG